MHFSKGELQFLFLIQLNTARGVNTGVSPSLLNLATDAMNDSPEGMDISDSKCH